MAKRETYYYIFHYVDGTKQEFEQDNSGLSTAFMNTGRQRVQIENELINLDNVIRVTVETQTERDEKQRKAEEQSKETYEALKTMRF